MKDDFEQIREQIHDIRNFIGPLDIKLTTLENHITATRVSFESKALQFESRISECAQKIGWHSNELADHSERIKRIEAILKAKGFAE